MKHLKKFEELNKSTYLSAASKLLASDHKNRAKALTDFASDMIVSDDDFTFYVNRGHSTVNPKTIVAKITDIEIERRPKTHWSKPDRTFIDKVRGRNNKEVEVTDYYNLSLHVKFSDGSFYIKEIGTEHLQEDLNDRIHHIIFTTRKDAVKFVKLCNDYIKENTKKHNFYAPVTIKYLNVNDFYRN